MYNLNFKIYKGKNLKVENSFRRNFNFCDAYSVFLRSKYVYPSANDSLSNRYIIMCFGSKQNLRTFIFQNRNMLPEYFEHKRKLNDKRY